MLHPFIDPSADGFWGGRLKQIVKGPQPQRFDRAPPYGEYYAFQRAVGG